MVASGKVKKEKIRTVEPSKTKRSPSKKDRTVPGPKEPEVVLSRRSWRSEIL